MLNETQMNPTLMQLVAIPPTHLGRTPNQAASVTIPFSVFHNGSLPQCRHHHQPSCSPAPPFVQTSSIPWNYVHTNSAVQDLFSVSAGRKMKRKGVEVRVGVCVACPSLCLVCQRMDFVSLHKPSSNDGFCFNRNSNRSPVPVR